VRKERAEGGNVVWLNAGDFYQGTVWYSHFKWRVVARFNNLLNFDAMTLGNHEFDDGVKGLVPFLRNQSVPVVVSNIDIRDTPALAGLYSPSVVLKVGKLPDDIEADQSVVVFCWKLNDLSFQVGDRKVGIVGYLTPETLEVSNPGKLIIKDELEPVRAEVERLHNMGVNIIIGLGHSGYQRDMQLAESVPHLDVVVGGHTHSFLYSGHGNPSNNRIEVIAHCLIVVSH
jgi:5'-nucleotidase